MMPGLAAVTLNAILIIADSFPTTIISGFSLIFVVFANDEIVLEQNVPVSK